MPFKSKLPKFTSQFPWEDVTANTLRKLVQDLGYHQNATKATMISFLHQVEENGLQYALENLAAQESTTLEASTTPRAPRPRTQSLKRKKAETPVDDEEDAEDKEEPEDTTSALPYNTRHKGLKRPRVTADPIPSSASPRRPRPRKAQPEIPESISTPAPISDAPIKRRPGRPRKSAVSDAGPSSISAAPAAGPSANGVVKRGRGRPRKSTGNAAQAAPTSTASASNKKKAVFLGVVLKQRTRELTEDDDADGEIDDGEGNVLVIANNGAETSSLGSSNKENYPEPPAIEHQLPPIPAEQQLVDALNSLSATNNK